MTTCPPNSQQPAASSFLEVHELRKAYERDFVVDGVTFGVEPGKIVTLLGPSGCGKTTTLRCIAGLEVPNDGAVRIGGDVVASPARGIMLPPERRNVGMVFQSYAVWPHLTVAQNLALPLEIRRVPADERRRRVSQVLELVGLEGYEDRYANRLSGGQQQRVALARALIYNPRLLLFDEPLSNLDAKLRERMRFEIRRLQREVGITSVYVTHDQAEAMIISDRIIVMNRGRIEQEGDARTLYAQPATAFVATFLGVANLVRGLVDRAKSDHERVGIVTTSEHGTTSVLLARPPTRLPANGEVFLSIRPEDVQLHPTPPERPNVLPGTIESVGYLGNLVEYTVRQDGRAWRVQSHPSQLFAVGDAVALELPPHCCLTLPADEGTADDADQDVESAHRPA